MELNLLRRMVETAKGPHTIAAIEVTTQAIDIPLCQERDALASENDFPVDIGGDCQSDSHNVLQRRKRRTAELSDPT